MTMVMRPRTDTDMEPSVCGAAAVDAAITTIPTGIGMVATANGMAATETVAMATAVAVAVAAVNGKVAEVVDTGAVLAMVIKRPR